MRLSPRIERIDALRGLALMGIVQVNIQSFTWGPGDVLGYLAQPPGAAESALYFLQAALLEGKCYPVFAFLFGLGLGLQWRSWQGRPGGARALRVTTLRRLVFLLAAGVLHGLLLYYGDVLAAYAICAGIALAVLRPPCRPRAVLMLAWAALAAVVLSLGAPFAMGGSPQDEETASLASADGDDAQADAAALPEELRAAHEVYAQGGYRAQLGQRAGDELWQQLGSAFTFWPQVVLLLALGMLAGRQGWLRHPRRHPRVWAWARRLGWGIGLPCALLGAALDLDLARTAPGASDDTANLVATLGSLLAAGYVAAAIGWLDRHAAVRRALAAAGRMSFTNYLLQSLLQGLLLCGWGLGLGASAGRGTLALLALAIFGTQMIASRWWLARHEQGPLEALWRRWTYGRPGAASSTG